MAWLDPIEADTASRQTGAEIDRWQLGRKTDASTDFARRLNPHASIGIAEFLS